MIATSTALLLGGLAAAGGSVASGVIGSRAAKGAANTHSRASQQVADQALQTSGEQADILTGYGERGATDITEAARKAGSDFWLSADDANSLLRSIYGNAMDSLEPYTATGRNAIQTLNAALGPEGDFNRTFAGEDLYRDPGYQFRLSEGEKALQRSAALRGGALGGATLKSLAKYSQGVASNEYQNAFDRFRSDRSDRFGMLYNLAGIGQRATEVGIGAGETYGGRAAGNIMRAGEFEANVNNDAARAAAAMRLDSVGDAANLRMRGLDIWGNALTGAANAQAAGQIVSGNAWSNTLSSLGRTAMDLGYLYGTQRNPYEPKPLPVGRATRVPGSGVPGYDPATGTYRP